MAVRPIVITGEPVLHQTARRVEAFDAELVDIVADMYETMDVAHGVGLAAPQIGVPLRLFVYEMGNDDRVPPRGVVVNPILTLGKISTDRPDPDDESEGCLSVPGENYPLKRAEHVRVQGFDVDGNPVEFEATGWFARCMQHEFDHLNGKLYTDRLDERQARKARKAITKNGWGVPGGSWMPGVDADPFGHDEDDLDEGGHDEHLV
ncbi:peptide deformylase [Lapillicoccus sp.]|uniref:peptide deformylase n=1 Tax=Lapillicoccus sp. TaxID=1909287 RepID=UPI0025CCC6D2|nr:peptide deformylase [Lapillicoccus sp.]